MKTDASVTYKIDKGIPIPSCGGGSRAGQLTTLIRGMEVGDSILIPRKLRNSASQRFVGLRSKKFITGTISATECRIWRVG